MFDKSKIVWHLTQMEIAANLDEKMRAIVAEVATKSGAMERALQYAKENDDRALGAVYLVVCMCDKALATDAPQPVTEALESLLWTSIDVVESRYGENPLACELLQGQIMLLQQTFLEQSAEKEAGDAGDLEFWVAEHVALTGNMPDVTKREPFRTFQSGRYLLLALRDVPPVADQVAPNPINLRFTYVLAVVDSGSGEPVYFVGLESSAFASDVLTTIDASGNHRNLGSDPEFREEARFVDLAAELAMQNLGTDEIRDLRR